MGIFSVADLAENVPLKKGKMHCSPLHVTPAGNLRKMPSIGVTQQGHGSSWVQCGGLGTTHLADAIISSQANGITPLKMMGTRWGGAALVQSIIWAPSASITSLLGLASCSPRVHTTKA